MIGTGTITAVNNQEKIVGVGTLFTQEVSIGDWISVGTESKKVRRVVNDLELTVHEPFLAPPAGVAFKIIKHFHELRNRDGEWFEDAAGKMFWGVVNDYGTVSYYYTPNGDPACPIEPVNPAGVTSEDFSDLNIVLRRAEDWEKSFTWLDAGECNSRVDTIEYYSPSLALTVTKTFTYITGTNSLGRTYYELDQIILS